VYVRLNIIVLVISLLSRDFSSPIFLLISKNKSFQLLIRFFALVTCAKRPSYFSDHSHHQNQMEVIELKEKLATRSFEVVEKIAGNSQKVAESLHMSPAISFGSNETSRARPKPDRRACMHGSRLFRYVRVNYPYKRRIQPEMY